MKRLYWRPSKIPRQLLIVLAVLAIIGGASVELFKVDKQQPHHTEKLQAARAMQEGMALIKAYHLAHIGPIDQEVDPAESGLIGLARSPITSTFGVLSAKQTSLNPNWAAVMVELFKGARVKAGDVVAIGFTGSFPALNLAVLTAAKVLKLNAIPIVSVSASMWGANIPQLTWLDMENLLYQKGVIAQRSVAASFGGLEDRALHRRPTVHEALQTAIARNHVQAIDGAGLTEGIEQRVALYRELAADKPIAVYVNVGEGAASVGPGSLKRFRRPGLYFRLPPSVLRIDSVSARFARERVPIIHIAAIDVLAERYGLPQSPLNLPPVGRGPLFVKRGYRLYLAEVNLAILLCLLYVCLRRDIGYHIFAPTHANEPPQRPEPMV
jgi:poly-gamma-glutamate system protein